MSCSIFAITRTRDEMIVFYPKNETKRSRNYDCNSETPYSARHHDDRAFCNPHGRHGSFSRRQGAPDFGNGAACALGGAHRAEQEVVRSGSQGKVQSLPHHADRGELRNPAVRNPACRERHDDGVVRSRNGERSARIRADGASCRLALVLSFYVRAFGDAHQRDFQSDKGEAVKTGESDRCFRQAQPPCNFRAKNNLVFIALVCAYGVYAFIARGIAKYLFFRQPFFFFDLEKGYLLFAADYLSILVLIATITHLVARVLQRKKEKEER